MSICGNTLINSGIGKNCADINAAIGLEKDLILVNYDDFDWDATFNAANRELDNTNNNEGGLSKVYLKAGAVPYTFEGTDYSVQPTVSSEVKEDGNSWFIHSILFTVYNKSSEARNVLEDLGWSRVVAVAVDRSTGFHELFGADQGLKISALERAYVGTQNSNFYQVTLATPDIAVVRESTLGILSDNGVSVSS